MNNAWKKHNGHKKVADDFNITACDYPPQEPKQGLPEYAGEPLPAAPVAATGDYIISRPVLPFGFSSGEDWQALLDSALGRGNDAEHAATARDADEDTRLETLIQAIVEHGQEMLPLLRLLREKAAEDERLSDIVNLLQDRLSLGISAACTLAPREMEVLELAAKGESNANIARILNLQTVTVAKALSRAYRKLDAKNRTDAVHKWMLIRGAAR